MKTVKIVLLGAVIVLGVVFVISNLGFLARPETLRVNLIFTVFESPPTQIGLMLLFCFCLGFILAGVLGMVKRRRLKKAIRELNQRQARTEEELNSLRNLPITGRSVESGTRDQSGAVV
ncbi:MAG: LapA family protein [Thermodesulfobacteriota bacterium]